MDDSERLREMLFEVQRERDDLRLKLDIDVGDSKYHVEGKLGMTNDFMVKKSL